MMRDGAETGSSLSDGSTTATAESAALCMQLSASITLMLAGTP